MPFLTEKQLRKIGFKSLGFNVKISSRSAIYNPDQIEIGDHSRIDDFCVVSGKVVIGKNVHFAVFNNVAGGEMGVNFHDFSGLAYGCHVFTQSDDYSGRTLTNPTVPGKFKSETKLPIVIGRHSIIGACSLIFPGVTLGEGCAIGANSMVNKSTEPWSVYFGNPAKRIRSRHQDLLKLEQAYLNVASPMIV